MYDFKRLPESVRSVLIAAAIVAATMVASTDFSKIESWRVWLIALGVAVLHAASVAALGALTGSKPTPAPAPASPPAPPAG